VLAAEFAGSRRETGLVTWTSPQTVALPLGYLREIGVVPGPAPSAGDGRLEELLAAYRRFLLAERSLFSSPGKFISLEVNRFSRV
jgi:integrase/recombinase XerD